MRLPLRIFVAGLLSFLGVSWVCYWFGKDLAAVVRRSEHDAQEVILETSAAISVCPEPAEEKRVDPWDPSTVLRDGARRRFRYNLRRDVHYITAWTTAGFTNQFISTVNMIYLGLLSDRVPIIPPFVPSHHLSSHNTTTLPFSEVFNITLFRDNFRKPVIEWQDVKFLSEPLSVKVPPVDSMEPLGCWTTRPGNLPPVWSDNTVSNLVFDPSYTRIPPDARLPAPRDDFTNLHRLAPYLYPIHPLRAPSTETIPSRGKAHTMLPDQQVACLDMLYFSTSSQTLYEWEQNWCPMWTLVGKHMRFTSRLEGLARKYLAGAMGVVDQWHLPPFIAIHVRRGDFEEACQGVNPGPQCAIPLSTYDQHVKDFQKELLQNQNLTVERVVVFSDSTSPDWWNEVQTRGWHRLDHQKEKTEEKLGNWYPTIIDLAAMSMANGFVGNTGSTYSLISGKRVESWNDGPFVMARRPTDPQT